MPDMKDNRWWDAWPTAITTDDEIEDMAHENGEDIARELLTHIRDERLREEQHEVTEPTKPVTEEQGRAA